jgi:peptidoglycan/LPS O-acetylase OafA/YrhL
MATPERRTAPGTPVTHTGAPAAAGPVPVMAPLGWVLILVSGIGLILASWLLYGQSADAMWAGYRDGVIGTTVLLAGMGLNTSLPKQPLLGICGLAGILLILFAVFLDDETAVFVSELLAGIGLLVGVGLFASGRRD